MNPYLHDVLRLLRGPMSITLVILTGVLGISGTVLFVAGQQTSSNIDNQVACEYDHGYRCLLYAFDTTLYRPLSGLSVTTIARQANTSFPTTWTDSITTGSDGLAWATWPMPSGDYVVEFDYVRNSGAYSFFANLNVWTPDQVGLDVGSPIIIHRGLFPQTTDLQVLLIGAASSAPVGATVGYLVLPNSSAGTWSDNYSIPASQFIRLGTVDAFVSYFPLAGVADAAGNHGVVYGLFRANASIIVEGQLTSGFNSFPFGPTYGGNPLAPPPGDSTPGGSILRALLLEAGLFVPLFGVLCAYSAYGRARVSGTLESVLARPVNRSGLTLSRYATVAVEASLALVAFLAVLQVSVLVATGYAFPFWVVLAIFGAFFVEWMALAGLTLVLSHGLRSSGSLVGGGGSLFLMFVLAWPNFTALLPSLVIRNQGDGYYAWLAKAYLPNPAEFQNAVSSLAFGFSPAYGAFDIASVGVTAAVVVGVGVAWVALPAAGFYALARWRD